MINGIIVNKYKMHSNLNTSLNPGITLVQGPNYSGKTSLLEAICYALYGPRTVGGSAEDLGPVQVAVEFSTIGHKYVVLRTAKKAVLECDGERVAEGQASVTDAVSKVLGLTSKQFMDLRVSRQGDTSALLTTGATALHKLVETVTGADQVSRVLDWMRDHAIELKGSAAVLTASQVPDLENKRTDVARLENVLRDAAVSTATAAEEIKKLRGDLAAGRESLQEALDFNESVRAARIDYDLCKQNIQSATERVLSLQKGLANGPHVTEGEVEGIKRKLESAREERNKYADAENGRREAIRAYALAEVTATSALARLNAVCDRRDKVKGQMESAPNLSALRMELSKLHEGIVEQDSESLRMSDLLGSSSCPTCGRVFDHTSDREVENWTVLMKKAKAAALGMRSRATDTRSKIVDAEMLVDTYNKLCSECDFASKAADKAIESKARAAAARDEWSNLLRETRCPPNIEPLQQEYDRLFAEYVQKQTIVGLLEAELSKRERLERKLGEIPEPGQLMDIDECIRKVQGLEAKVGEAEARYTHLDRKYRADYDTWFTLGTVIERGADVNRKLADVEADQAAVKTLSALLRERRTAFLSDVWKRLLQQASTFAEQCTNGAVTTLGQDDKGGFFFVHDGVKRPVVVASGAQRAILGLGLRLALSEMLASECDFVLLDEPTADTDTTHSMAVTTALSNTGRQMVVVSHRELDGLAADQIIQLEG